MFRNKVIQQAYEGHLNYSLPLKINNISVDTNQAPNSNFVARDTYHLGHVNTNLTIPTIMRIQGSHHLQSTAIKPILLFAF